MQPGENTEDGARQDSGVPGQREAEQEAAGQPWDGHAAGGMAETGGRRGRRGRG